MSPTRRCGQQEQGRWPLASGGWLGERVAAVRHHGWLARDDDGVDYLALKVVKGEHAEATTPELLRVLHRYRKSCALHASRATPSAMCLRRFSTMCVVSSVAMPTSAARNTTSWVVSSRVTSATSKVWNDMCATRSPSARSFALA
uniref:Uncharacterized protein n=1 Tax=Oryza punctata TaxID=4537 RepID=A0A0E0M1J6_ORYPU